MFKVVRSNTEIATTPLRMVRFHSIFTVSTHPQTIHYKCSRSKVKCRGRKVKGQGHSLA